MCRWKCLHAVGLEHIAFERPKLVGGVDVLNGLFLIEERFVGREAESLVGNGQDAVVLHREDGDVGRQSGLQLEVAVGCGDDHLIGDHVALGGGLLTHLLDGTLEDVVGEGINGERDALTYLYVTNVGFVNVGNNPHVGEVLGNGEEFGRVEGGGHGLTFLHRLGEHHAVDGRGDGGIAEVGLSPAHTLAGGVHLLLGLLVTEAGILEIVGADQSLVVKCLIAGEIGFLIVEVALLAVEVGLGRVELADEVGLVEFGNNLSFPHYAVVIHIEAGYDTRHLRTHGH